MKEKRKMDQFPSILLFMMDIKLIRKETMFKRENVKLFLHPKIWGFVKLEK